MATVHPFLDRLNQPVRVGDLIYRSTYQSLEKVIDSATYVKNGQTYTKIKTVGFVSLDKERLIYTSKTWYRNPRDIFKLNMSPEVQSALAILEGDYSKFEPKLILDFKV